MASDDNGAAGMLRGHDLNMLMSMCPRSQAHVNIGVMSACTLLQWVLDLGTDRPVIEAIVEGSVEEPQTEAKRRGTQR